MKKVVFLIAILIAIVSGAALKAQVTIGSNIPPNPGSLLDLKTNNTSGANATGGFMFPRVNITTLSPTTPAELAASIGGTGNWDLQTHIGLVVYNVGGGAVPAAGLYIWSGTRWITFVATHDMPINVTAKNGLIMDSAGEIKLGGDLTDTKTTIKGDDKGIVFDFEATKVDNPNQGLFIPKLPHLLTSRYPLAVDVNTGKLGLLSGESEAKIAFLQSNVYSFVNSYNNGTGNTADLTNAANTFIIPWNVSVVGPPSTGGDIITNNLVKFIPSENSFELLEDVAVELSGYIGYAVRVSDGSNPGPTGTGTATSDVAIVNASIQIKRAASTNGLFENYSSVRGSFATSVTPYRQTLNIPPSMFVGKAGDRIRMVVIPEPSGLGAEQPRAAIVTPYGSDFCKSLKIIAQ